MCVESSKLHRLKERISGGLDQREEIRGGHANRNMTANWRRRGDYSIQLKVGGGKGTRKRKLGEVYVLEARGGPRRISTFSGKGKKVKMKGRHVKRKERGKESGDRTRKRRESPGGKGKLADSPCEKKRGRGNGYRARGSLRGRGNVRGGIQKMRAQEAESEDD